MALVITHPKIQAYQGLKGKQGIGIERSWLQGAEYDSESQQMTWTTLRGAQYVTFGVTPSQWEEFKIAQSKGRFLNAVIRKNHGTTKTVSKNIGKPVKKAT